MLYNAVQENYNKMHAYKGGRILTVVWAKDQMFFAAFQVECCSLGWGILLV